MMFKVLVIQTINALSDERTEYLINDRLSFMRLAALAFGSWTLSCRTECQTPRRSGCFGNA